MTSEESDEFSADDASVTDEIPGKTQGKRMKRERDRSWILTKSAPGGPLKPHVIPSFGGHIAATLWSHPKRDRVLTVYTRERSIIDLQSWVLSDEGSMSIVTSSGLQHLRSCMLPNLDIPLLSAFVERWQPDTNTFHMPFGEITILLHDVWHILRVAVDGNVCSASASSDDLQKDMCELLGLSPHELVSPFGEKRKAQIYRSGGVLVEALRSITRSQMDDELAAQRYLMYILGSTLFVDRSGDRIRAVVNLLLKEVKEVKSYAWGTGALAYLYRQLGVASRSEGKGICGCLSLLQAWIYEYFPTFRPTSDFAREVSLDSPRVLMWDGGRPGSRNDINRLKHYRAVLDLLTVDQVTWLPYGNDPAAQVPRSVFYGCIRFVDVIEPYQLDRCLRQFGFKQVIPTPMMPPTEADRPAKSALYNVKYPEWTDNLWKNWDMHVVNLSRVSTLAAPAHAVSDDYMQWWYMISHPIIVNPVLAQGELIRELRPSHNASRDIAAVRIAERLAPILLIPPEQRTLSMENLWKVVDELKPLLSHFKG